MNRTVTKIRSVWSFILCVLTLCGVAAVGAAPPAWAPQGG